MAHWCFGSWIAAYYRALTVLLQVFKHIIDEVISGQDTNPTHIKLIEQFITAMSELQNVENLSGSVASGDNLGEPKFMADGSAFTEHWGRPQRGKSAVSLTEGE
jgi:glucoamylase